jgi:uncharacterized protein
MKAIASISLLVVANFFMTFAWYGHLQFKKWNVFSETGLLGIILISWFIALFEYVFQVPANKIGSDLNNGPFTLFQLKIIQEVISISVFIVCSIFIFKTDKFSTNYLYSFIFILIAVYFAFKK